MSISCSRTVECNTMITLHAFCVDAWTKNDSVNATLVSRAREDAGTKLRGLGGVWLAKMTEARFGKTRSSVLSHATRSIVISIYYGAYSIQGPSMSNSNSHLYQNPNLFLLILVLGGSNNFCHQLLSYSLSGPGSRLRLNRVVISQGPSPLPD